MNSKFSELTIEEIYEIQGGASGAGWIVGGIVAIAAAPALAVLAGGAAAAVGLGSVVVGAAAVGAAAAATAGGAQMIDTGYITGNHY